MTALAATYLAPTGSNPAGWTLNVTAAPSPPTTKYTSNFAAGVDGWSGNIYRLSDGTFVRTGGVTNDTTTTPASLKISGGTGLAEYTVASRTVTGLTAGTAYRLQAFLRRGQGMTKLGVATIGETEFTYPGPTRTAYFYDFTATATSHVITITGKIDPPQPGLALAIWAETITVTPTAAWSGTVITRTDANGTDVPVRNPNKLDTTGGVMTLVDYEAAMTGTVTWKVTDGSGGTATANGTPPAAGTAPQLTLPASGTPPLFAAVSMVIDYDETAVSPVTVHQVLGRSDKLSNPGPMLARAGTLEIWCATYADTLALRNLLRNAGTAFLRQADFPGLDLYFVAREIATAPGDATPTRRWLTSVTYDEIPRPA